MAVGNNKFKLKIVFTLFLSFFLINNVLGQTTCGNNPDYNGSPTPVCDNATINSHASNAGHWEAVYPTTLTFDHPNQQDNVNVYGLIYPADTVRWVDNSGCVDTLVIYSNFIPSNAGSDIVGCDVVTLSANNPSPGTGTWTTNASGVTFSNVNNPTATASNIPVGTWEFYWTITYNDGTTSCTDKDTVLVSNVTPTPVDAGVADTTCTGDSIQLSATPPPGGSTGQWTQIQGSGTIKSTTLYNTWVTNLQEGENTFRWTVSNGTCSASDTVAIYNYTLHIADATPTTPKCDTASIAVTVQESTDGATGYWEVVASTATLASSTDFSTLASGLNPGANTFKFVASYNGCKDSLEITINSSLVKAVASVSSSTVCNDTVNLIGNAPPTGGSGLWDVIVGSGTINAPTNASTYATGLTKGINSFTWKITTAEGCVDYDTVDVTYDAPDQAVISTPDKTVCDPRVSLSAQAVSYGTGYWSGPAGATYSPNASATTVNVTGLNSGINTFVWHVTTGGSCPESTDTVKITYTPIVATASASTDTLCSDTVYLTGNDPSTLGATGSWSIITGSGTIDNVNSYSTFAYGLSPVTPNQFVWTVTNGACKDADTVTVVYGAAAPALITDDTLVSCDGNRNLAANNPAYGSGYWTGPGGVNYNPSSTDNNVTVSNLPVGTNAFVWHVKNHDKCAENTDTVYVIYDNLFADAGGPYDTTCNGSINLAASMTPGATGTWSSSGSATFSNVNDPNATVSNLDYGANNLTWTVTLHGCTAYDNVTVYNYAADPAVAGNDQHVCSNEATLAANPVTNGTGLWTTSGSATIVNPTNNNTLVRNLDPGGNSFVWTVTNGTCQTSDTVIIYNDSVSVADAGVAQYICKDSTQLAANTPTIGVGRWSVVSGGATFDNVNDPGTLVRSLARGQNILQWEIYNPSDPGCHTTDTVSIYNLSVDAYFTNEPVITCEDTAVVVGNNISGQNLPGFPASGHWTSLSGTVTFDNPNTYNTIARNLSLDTNLVTWTITNGVCTDVDTLAIINNDPGHVFAGDDTVICFTEFDLQADNPMRGTGHWYLLGGNATFTNPTDPRTHVADLEYFCRDTTPNWWSTVNAVNILEWRVTYNGCTRSDTVRIINAKPGIINAGIDTTVCSTTASLNALDLGSCAQTHWWTAIPPGGLTFRDPYDGSVDNTDFNAVVEGLQAGTTAFIWHKQNIIGGITCTLTDTVQITSLNLTADLNAGSDDVVCDTVYKLNAVPPSAVIVNSGDKVYGSWAVIYGNGTFDDSTLYNTYVRNLGFQTNILRWTVVNETQGCVSMDDVYITNALPSNAVVFNNDTVVCTDEANLSANRPVRGIGHWEVYGGGTAILSGDTCQDWYCDVYVTNLQTGLNTFLWVVENSYSGPGGDTTCKLVDTAYVFYNQVIADAGDTMYRCADTASLRANLPGGTPPYVGQWSITNGSGTFATTGNTTSNDPLDTVRGLQYGKNTLTWTLSRTIDGVTCSDQDNLIIWNNLPPDPYAGTDQVVCTDSAYLTGNTDERNEDYLDITNTNVIATARTSSYWTAIGGVATFNNSTDPTTWVHGLNPQQNNYIIWNKELKFYDSITGFAQTCILTDTVLIYNNAVTAVAGAIPSGIICGDPDTAAYVLLNATNPGTGLTGYWSFVSGSQTPTIDNSTSPTTGAHNLGNGTNVFSWTVENTVGGVTCSAYDTVNVEVRIPTKALVASPDSFEVCEDTAALQANNPVLGVGHWEPVYPFSGKIVDSLSPSTSVRNLWSGKTKWVWIIDNDGCTSSDTITVINDKVTSDAYTLSPNNTVNICVDTFQLYATDPNTFNSQAPYASGQWTTGGSATFDDPTAYNTVVRNLSNTNPNVLVWTITKGGCSASDQLIIYNNYFTIDAAVSYPKDTMYTCEDTIQLDGEQPGTGTGLWTKLSGGGIFVNNTLYNTVVRNISTTEANVYEWLVQRNGCEARDTVVVISNKVTSQAGADKVVCYDTTSLDAGVPPIGATGTWLNDLGSGTFANANDPKTHVSGLDRGVNTFIWRVEKAGCTARDTVQVINNMPEAAVAEADKEVCADTTTLVVASPPVSDLGYWKLLTGNGNIADSTSFNAKVSGLQPGINRFLWIVTRGTCTDVDTLVITNNQVAANAGLDDTVCADTALIAALGPTQFYPFQGTGTWSDAGGTGVTFDNVNDSVTIARGLKPGTNQLRWTVTKGSCSAYDDVIIANRAVSAMATNISECSFPVTLTGNDPVSDNGIWRNLGGLGTIADPTLYNSSYTGLDYGLTNTLRWIVYNESCADSIDITVTNRGFTVFAGPNDTLCADTAGLNAQLPGPGAQGTWSVVSGSGNFDDVHNPNTTVRNLNNGANVLRWTVDYNGCTNSSTVTVVNSLPSQALITGINAGCDSTASLTAYQPSPYYATRQYWKVLGPHTFTSDSTDFTATVSDLDPGQTNVVWVIENDRCQTVDTGVIQNNAVKAYVGGDQNVCDSVTVIQALDPLTNPPYQGSGVWTANKAVNIENPTKPQTRVTGLPVGATTFTWTVSKGSCSDAASMVVYNNQIFASAYDTVTCTDSAYLVGNDPYLTPGGSGQWVVASGVYDSIVPDTAPNAKIYGLTYNSTVTVIWHVSNGKCSDDDTITVTSNNFYISAGTGDTICVDTFALHGSSYEVGDVVSWSVQGGGGSFDRADTNETVVRNLNPGKNTLRWTITHNGCTKYDEIAVVNNEPSDPQILTQNDTTVCDGQITLRATNPSQGQGYWSQITGSGMSGTVSANITTVTGLDQNNNLFRWTVTKGNCSKSADVNVINNQVFSNAGPDDTTCESTYTLLAAAPPIGATGVWKDESGTGITFANVNDPNTVISNIPQQTTVTLSWTVTKDICSAVDYVKITNLGVTATASDQTVCDTTALIIGNDPSVFTKSPAHGKWIVVGAPGVWIVNDTLANTTVNGLPYQNTTTLYWKIYNDFGCADSTQVKVINNGFRIDAGPDQAVCYDTAKLEGQVLAGASSSYWTVTSGNGTFDNSTLANTIVRGLNLGSNVFTWHVEKDGCSASDNVTITNNEVIVDAGSDQSICVDTFKLNGTNPSTLGGTGYWTVAGGQGNFDNSTLYNTIVRNLRRGINTLRWTVTANGCTNYDDVVITNNSFDVDPGVYTPVCSDTVLLNAKYINGGSGYWSVQGSSPATIDQSDTNVTVARNLQQGTNVFRWTVTKNGCTFYADASITNDLPNPPVILTPNPLLGPDTVCNNTVFLQAQKPEPGVSGTWSYTGSGGTILHPNSDTTTVINLNPGSTQFVWTVQHNSCSLSTTVTVVNGAITANAGADQTSLCQDYTSLAAVAPQSPAIGWWEKADGQPGVIADTADPNTQVTNLGYGDNKFVWNIKNGRCSAKDTVLIVNNSASPAIVGSVAPTCTGEAFLTATNPAYGTGVWSYVGTYPVTIESPSSANTRVTNLEYGANLFKWTVTNTTAYTTCTDDTTVTVLNYQFTVDAGDDKIQCDSVFHLSAQTRPNQDSAKWTIVVGSPTIVDTTDPNTTVYVTQGGSAILKWKVWENGCYAEDDITLQNFAVTAIAYDQEVCDTTVNLQAVSPGSGNNGYWTSSFSDIKFDPNNSQYNATAHPLHPGANQFTWHVYNAHCQDSTTIVVNYLIPYAYAGADQDICTDVYTLGANDPSLQGGSGKWAVYSGSGTFDNDTVYNTVVRGLAKGTNVLSWTVTVRACSHTDFVTINNLQPTVSVGEDQEICQSETSLSGNNPDTSIGEYGFWTKVTPGPHWFADSTNPTTKVYNIQPGSEVFRWTIKNGSCEAYADLIVTNNSVIAEAGDDQAICADSGQLTGFLPSNATGVWSLVTPGPTIEDSTKFNTWVKNLNFGDNTFKWTVQKGICSSSDLVTITNNAPPVNAGSDQTICQNYTTLFGSLPPDTVQGHGVWRLVGGSGVLVDSTKNVTKVTDLSSGANVFTWTVYYKGCSSSDEVIITNNELPVDAGADEPALCDDEFELNANPPDSGATGHWTVVAGYGEIDNPDSNITWVRNLARGENVLRWTVTKNGCSNYDEITVNNITPTQAITIGTKEVCEDYTTITGNKPRYGVGHWEIVTSSGAVTIDNSLSNSTVVRNLAAGPNQFAWVIVDTASGCSTSDTVTVNNNSVVASAGLDKEICMDTFKLEAVDPAPDSGYWTVITPGGVIASSEVNNPKAVVRNLPTGANILRWTVTNGKCSSFDDVVITNNEPTQANAGKDQISCDGNAVLLGNTPARDESGLWIRQSGDGVINDSTKYWTSVTNLSPGKNTFIWTITRGSCVSSDTVNVINHNILVDAGHDMTICNRDTAELRGNPPGTGVSGFWTLTGGQGDIDNSTSYITTVRNLGPGSNTFRWTLQDSVCSNYDEIIVVNNTPTKASVCYDTVHLCQDHTTLCANSPTGIETGYWTVAAGNAKFDNSNNPSSDVYNLSKNVTLLWHIAKNGCESVDTMYIFNGEVQALVNDDTLKYCGPDGYLVAVEPIDTTAVRYWELISGQGNIADSTAFYTSVSNLALGANIFRWHVEANGCKSKADVVVYNNKYPANANMAATNPICDSQVVVLGNPPVAGAVGHWSVASGSPGITFDSPNSPTTVVRNLGNGITSLKWSIIKDGCENYDTVIVINNSVYADAGQDATVCDTNEVASIIANDPLTANGLYGYWSVVSGSVTIADTTAYATTVTNVAYGANTLKWTVVGKGCQDEDVMIVSNNHFTVTAGSDFVICDTTTILTGTDPGPGGSGIWSVSGSGWFEDPTNYTTRVNGVAPGSNTYIWTVTKNGCTAHDQVVVTNATPTAFAGGDIAICVDTFQLKATPPNKGSGVWSIVSGGGSIDSSTNPNSIVRNLAKGKNILRWTVRYLTCTASDDVTITNNMVTATAGIDQQVCDTIAYLAADPPGTGGYGVWSIDAGGGWFVDSTLFNTAVYGLNDGTNTFRWTVYENGCSNSTTVKITNNRFSVNAGKDTTVFSPTATLHADSWSGSFPYSGTWSIVAGGGVFADAHSPTTNVSNLAYGINTFRWFVTNKQTGCTAYDDVNVTYIGFSVDAGADQDICKDSTVLSAQSVNNATQYWSVVQGGGDFEDPTNPATKVTKLARGVNIFRWNVIKNGFSTYDEVRVTNYAFDTYAGTDQDLCDDNAQLNAEYMFNYSVPLANPNDIHSEWQILSGGGVIASSSDAKTTVTGLNPGDNVVRWYVERTDFPGTGVCAASDTIHLRYHHLPQTSFATVPDVPEGCSPLEVSFYNTTPTFDTIPGTVYYWNIANASLIKANYSDTITRTFVNESQKDSIYPIWLIAEADVAPGVICRDTAYGEVTVLPVPVIRFTAPIYSVYSVGLQIPIEVSRETDRNCDRYQWDFGDGTGTVTDHLDSSFTHPYNTWGTYTISLTGWRKQCMNTYSLTIHIEPPEPVAEPNSTNNAQGCAPLTVPLYAQVLYTTDGVSQYKWKIKRARDTSVVAELHEKDVYYTFTDPGTYLVELWVTAEGTLPEPWSWAFIRTDTITVYPKPVADFTVEPMEVTVGELVKCYNYSKGATRYFWNFGYQDSSMTSTQFEPTISYPKPGEYYITLRVESDHYCTDQKTLDQPVVVIQEGELLFPTAFIPASNIELNRTFKPRYRGEVVEYELQVYNRWGQLIFVSHDVNQGWDGTINGRIAPQDVYAYKCEVKFRTGQRKVYTGSVTLLR